MQKLQPHPLLFGARVPGREKDTVDYNSQREWTLTAL